MLPLWTVGVVGYVAAGIFMSSALYFAAATLITPLITSVLVCLSHFLSLSLSLSLSFPLFLSLSFSLSL